jgi:hypothetical protein
MAIEIPDAGISILADNEAWKLSGRFLGKKPTCTNFRGKDTEQQISP